jgi:DNA anti-recombination protein RmuC
MSAIALSSLLGLSVVGLIYYSAWRGYTLGSRQWKAERDEQGRNACALFDECHHLRRELSLAEEGLANYQQELQNAKHDIERLMAAASAEANEVERLRTENQALRAAIDSRDKAMGFEPMPEVPQSGSQ